MKIPPSLKFTLIASPSLVLAAKAWLWVLGLGSGMTEERGFIAVIFVAINCYVAIVSSYGL